MHTYIERKKGKKRERKRKEKKRRKKKENTTACGQMLSISPPVPLCGGTSVMQNPETTQGRMNEDRIEELDPRAVGHQGVECPENSSQERSS